MPPIATRVHALATGTATYIHISDSMQRKRQGNNKCETGNPTLWEEANEYSRSNVRRVPLSYQTSPYLSLDLSPTREQRHKLENNFSHRFPLENRGGSSVVEENTSRALLWQSVMHGVHIL